MSGSWFRTCYACYRDVGPVAFDDLDRAFAAHEESCKGLAARRLAAEALAELELPWWRRWWLRRRRRAAILRMGSL